jgi:hypothetical protein
MLNVGGAGRVVNTLEGAVSGFDPGQGTCKNLLTQKRVCRMRLKTVVPCTQASMPGQVKYPTQVDSSM